MMGCVDCGDDGDDSNHGERERGEVEAAAVIGEVGGEGSRANSELLMAAMMATTPIVPRREGERGGGRCRVTSTHTTMSAGRADEEEGRMGPQAVELKARMLGNSNDADGKHRNEMTKMMTKMVST